jgi:hypothetical protein
MSVFFHSIQLYLLPRVNMSLKYKFSDQLQKTGGATRRRTLARVMWAGIFFPSRESLIHSTAKQRGFSPLQKGKISFAKKSPLTWHGPLFTVDHVICGELRKNLLKVGFMIFPTGHLIYALKIAKRLHLVFGGAVIKEIQMWTGTNTFEKYV